MDALIETFATLQQTLFEAWVQPLVFGMGQGHLLDKAFEGAGWLVVGLLQILILVLVIGPLQRLWPAEPVVFPKAIRVDVVYTLIHRLGLFKLVMFFSLDHAFEQGWGLLRAMGWPTFHLDALWPGVTDQALVSFVLYLVFFDFVHYWLHRAQHQSNTWWALHSLHHSQRQMTMWSDNRNHLLDDLLVDVLLVVAAQLIGMAPGQFIAIVALTQLSESLQHANLRLRFGRIGERLWVSPHFHRVHHSIHSSDHNFGVLLPWWDQLFGTANFQQQLDPTGVQDSAGQVHDYGRGLWSQQWQGLKRLMGRA